MTPGINNKFWQWSLKYDFYRFFVIKSVFSSPKYMRNVVSWDLSLTLHPIRYVMINVIRSVVWKISTVDVYLSRTRLEWAWFGQHHPIDVTHRVRLCGIRWSLAIVCSHFTLTMSRRITTISEFIFSPRHGLLYFQFCLLAYDVILCAPNICLVLFYRLSIFLATTSICFSYF